MQALFGALAEAEEQQPYLHDLAVRRGTRCLAEYHLGEYGRAWNRCVPGRGRRRGGPRTERACPSSPLPPADSHFFAAASSLRIMSPLDHLLVWGEDRGNPTPLSPAPEALPSVLCVAPGAMTCFSFPLARCWVLDRVDSWAVVMFIDFGRSATIPVQSLRSLDSDDFWTIPPLTQPFMLEKGRHPSPSS